MSLFKSNWGKWVPLGNWSFDGADYIVFARKNFKNGMIKFKTKRVNGYLPALNCVNNCLPSDLISTGEAWKKLNEV